MGHIVETGPGRYAFAIHATSTAPPEVVFALLADAQSWPRWSFVPGVQQEREGLPAPNGVSAIRCFGKGPIGSTEQVVVYQPPTHFAYTILSGMPVRNYRADVVLTPTLTGTKLVWRARFDPLLPGIGMLMRLLVARLARGLTLYASRMGTLTTP